MLMTHSSDSYQVKCREEDKEKIGGSQNLRVAYKLYIFVMK